MLLVRFAIIGGVRLVRWLGFNFAMPRWCTTLHLPPCVMTVMAIMAGVLSIFWNSSAGSEIMRCITEPMIGGMVSSAVLTLVVITERLTTPVVLAGYPFAVWQGGNDARSCFDWRT